MTPVMVSMAGALVLAGVVMTDFLTGSFTHGFDPDAAVDLQLDHARIAGPDSAGIGIAAPNALARSAHRDALRVVETVGLETRINVWIVHGALPGRLVRPVALLRDALAEVLDRENRVGSDAAKAV